MLKIYQIINFIDYELWIPQKVQQKKFKINKNFYYQLSGEVFGENSESRLTKKIFVKFFYKFFIGPQVNKKFRNFFLNFEGQQDLQHSG